MSAACDPGNNSHYYDLRSKTRIFSDGAQKS